LEELMDHAGGYQDYAFVADLYDYVKPYSERRDVAFFVDAARQAAGPVLEVGCGTGRVLIPTARAGVEITGLDLSTHMLRVCRERLAAEPPEVQERVQLVHGDMRDFDLGRTFALATIPFRPFQHLTTVADQIACLRMIHRHLAPGGRLILDIFNPSLEALTRDNLGQELKLDDGFGMPDGSRAERRHKIVSRDPYEQLINIEQIYYVTHPDGREERYVHAFPLRYLFRYEAEHLLVRCGFDVQTLYADYDKSPYGSQYPGELIFTARKL
jgi:SAM-dependent methyltransferase